MTVIIIWGGGRNRNNYKSCTGFEVLRVMVMKNSVFLDITPSSMLKVNWHFGGICDLHHQGWTISQARNQHEALLATCFMLVLAWLRMEATCSSKMSVGFQWITWRYIPEDRILLNYNNCSSSNQKKILGKLNSDPYYLVTVVFIHLISVNWNRCQLNSIIFWDVILSNSVEVCQCFRGTSVNSNQTILHYNPEVAAVRTSNPTEIINVIHFM
jgi:hypothetical protein